MEKVVSAENNVVDIRVCFLSKTLSYSGRLLSKREMEMSLEGSGQEFAKYLFHQLKYVS